jgi:hypothetical protein
MIEFNRNIYPNGGYVFTEADGTRLKASGWKSLESRIRGYRAVNRLDPGDPLAEIHVQYCAKMPHLCRQSGEPVPPGGVGEVTFNHRVLAWIGTMVGLKRKHDFNRVDSDTALSRANTCARCPKQKSLNHACEGCLLSLKDARNGLLDGIKARFKNLNPCGVLSEDCQVSVFVLQRPSNNPELPENCWRRSG